MIIGMAARLSLTLPLLGSAQEFPPRVLRYPRLRYMGSKFKLLPWIHSILSELSFETALDAFAGSGCVSYLLKAMDKQVLSNDFLAFPNLLCQGTIENTESRLSDAHCRRLLHENLGREDFIERTFKGIFYTPAELRFLDNLWANLQSLPTRHHRALAMAALIRACIKRQPRGVFTVAGKCEQYDDGRRDLRLSLHEQFLECVQAYNAVIFDNGKRNRTMRSDVLLGEFPHADLVYMDPPYVPRADDNCYIKRYHFIEGLATYWRESGILVDTKVKKIPKRFTPFSYRRTAIAAFDSMFHKFRESAMVLSYSSNGYPDLGTLVGLMRRHKKRIAVYERGHKYHFGTHARVSTERSRVKEYLIVGT